MPRRDCFVLWAPPGSEVHFGPGRRCSSLRTLPLAHHTTTIRPNRSSSGFLFGTLRLHALSPFPAPPQKFDPAVTRLAIAGRNCSQPPAALSWNLGEPELNDRLNPWCSRGSSEVEMRQMEKCLIFQGEENEPSVLSLSTKLASDQTRFRRLSLILIVCGAREKSSLIRN